MSNIYFSSTLMWKASLDDIFRTAYENGFAGIEFWAQHFMTQGYSVEDHQELRSLYPIKTIVHNYSWDLNLASLNDGIREASIRETKKAIDLTDSLGGYEITIHPGKITVETEQMVYFERLKRSLNEIYDYAKERYIDISLEIMEKKDKEFIVSRKDIDQLTGESFNKFYYTLDVAHCDKEEEIFDTLEHLKRISKIHISNRIGEKLHTPIRRGDYQFCELLPKLEKFRLDMVIEGFDLSREFHVLKDNIKFLKDIGGL